MKPETIMPIIVAFLYLATGLIHGYKGGYATCGLWLSYAIANCFIIFATKSGD